MGIGGRIPPLLGACARQFRRIRPWFDLFGMHPLPVATRDFAGRGPVWALGNPHTKMKIPTFISTAALLGSVIAVFLAGRHSQSPAQSAIDAMVDARLAARELKLVQSFAPEFRVIAEHLFGKPAITVRQVYKDQGDAMG